MEETTRHLQLYMPGDFDKLNSRLWPRWGARVHPRRWQAQATNTILNPNASQGRAFACPEAGVFGGWGFLDDSEVKSMATSPYLCS
jgi:hypothetical protein